MIKYYYPKTIRAITVALLGMFNDIRVVKYDKDGQPLSEKHVDITFGPVEKYHQDRTEGHYFDKDNVEHNQRYYQQLPRMALIPNGIAYDPDRATGVNEWRYWLKESLGLSEGDMDQIVSDYQPTPYNYNFTLQFKNMKMDYLSQILENILPYFNPSLQLRVKEFSFLNVERDLQVDMGALGFDFSTELMSEDTRRVNASIDLTVKGFMYRPFVMSKTIKVINARYFADGSLIPQISTTTTGVRTLDGVPIETSAIPPLSAYDTSGYYDGQNKEFDWFRGYVERPRLTPDEIFDGVTP